MMNRRLFAVLVGVLSLVGMPAISDAVQVVVADRLSNAVYRYDENGVYRGVVVSDPLGDFLGLPSGIVMSPDRTKMYVANLNGNVVQYDYSTATGKATNPSVFADSSDGLQFPNGLIFSPDGTKLYVSNLGPVGVSQFNLNGSSAGPPIFGLLGGGAFFQLAGMTYAPTGELLVAEFQDFPGASVGGVAKSDSSISFLTDFVPADPVINGASGLLVHGEHLYVTGMYPFLPTGNIARYDVNTGAVDAGFGISGVGSPQAIIADPNGNGFLVGLLGATDGTGHIAHYDFDGNLVGDGIFAKNANDVGFGFVEATAFTVVVPEPTTVGLAGIALLGFVSRRRLFG